MDKRANNRSRKPRGEASKARNMASRTARGLFVISRSGVQVRPPAPSSVQTALAPFPRPALRPPAKTAYRFVAPPPHAATASLGRVVKTGGKAIRHNLISNRSVGFDLKRSRSGGSELSALAGSETIRSLRRRHGGVPEWPKGTDCKSAGYAYGGSNPPAPTKTALISSKSGLFCNFSGHFAFQRMEG